MSIEGEREVNYDDEMELTEEHLQIMRHAIGLDGLRWYDKEKIEGEPYRNYFATTNKTKNYPIILDLIELGFMRKMGERWDMDYFCVTHKGVLLAKESALRIAMEDKPTRSKARYQAYRHSESEDSFIEWLTNPYWNDYRKRLGV